MISAFKALEMVVVPDGDLKSKLRANPQLCDYQNLVTSDQKAYIDGLLGRVTKPGQDIEYSCYRYIVSYYHRFCTEDEVYRVLCSIFPPEWQKLARMVANGDISDITYELDSGLHKLSCQLDGMTCESRTPIWPNENSFARQHYAYTTMLTQIKGLTCLRSGAGTFAFLKHCFDLDLIRKVKIIKQGFMGRLECEYKRLGAKGVGWIPCVHTSGASLNGDVNWSECLHSFREYAKDRIENTGLQAILKIQELGKKGPIAITKVKDTDAFDVYTSKEFDGYHRSGRLKMPESFCYDCYSYLCVFLDEFNRDPAPESFASMLNAAPETSAVKPRSEAGSRSAAPLSTDPAPAPALTLKLEPAPIVDQDHHFFITLTDLPKVGIYSIRNFDPVTMVIHSDEDTGPNIYLRHASSSQDQPELELDEVYAFHSNYTAAPRWYTAIARLGRDFDPTKKYMIVTNPKDKESHQRALELFNTLEDACDPY